MSLYVDIYKKFDDFTLNIKFNTNNDVTALFGLSGSGKSLTLKCIAGIIKPDKGTIIINDKVVFDSSKKINLPPKNRGVGYLPQSYALFPNMTVKENIKTGFYGKLKNRCVDEVDKFLRKFDLKSIENLYPNQISGGQQQRVALARALATSPDVLLLDEPFSALDSQIKSQLTYDFMSILSEYKSDVIYVSHDKNEVLSVCDSVCVINNGSCNDIRKKTEIFRKPTKTTDAVLLGIENIFNIINIEDNYAVTSGGFKVLCKEKDFDSIAFYSRSVRINDLSCDIIFSSKIKMIIDKESDIVIYLGNTNSQSVIKVIMSNNYDFNLNVGDNVEIGLNYSDIYYLK